MYGMRFAAGERVACAVEDESNDYSVWAAGTVLEVDCSIEKDAAALLPDREWAGDAGRVPYVVELDSGGKVLVHNVETSEQLCVSPRKLCGALVAMHRVKEARMAELAEDNFDPDAPPIALDPKACGAMSSMIDPGNKVG